MTTPSTDRITRAHTPAFLKTKGPKGSTPKVPKVTKVPKPQPRRGPRGK